MDSTTLMSRGISFCHAAGSCLLHWNGLYELGIVYSIMYFLGDIVYIVSKEFSILFLCHHGVTLFILIVSLTSGMNLTTLGVLMIFAELSNLLQIPWEIAKNLRWKYEMLLFIPYAVLFTFLRLVCAPVYMLLFIVEFFETGTPIWICDLMLMASILLFGASIYWMGMIWRRMYYKLR